MLVIPSGGHRGRRCGVGRLGANGGTEQSEAFADEPVRLARRAVVQDGAVGTHDGGPAEGRRPGQEGSVEILPAAFAVQRSSLTAVRESPTGRRRLLLA